MIGSNIIDSSLKDFADVSRELASRSHRWARAPVTRVSPKTAEIMGPIRFRRRLGRADGGERLSPRGRDNGDEFNAAPATEKPGKTDRPGEQRRFAGLQQEPQGTGIPATIAEPPIPAQSESRRGDQSQGEISGCQGDVSSHGERGDRQACPFQAERS